MRPWARDLSLALMLSAAMPSGLALAADRAEQTLLDKANYWRLKDRPDLAAEALNKLLALNPNQPDGLFQYGMLQVQLGKMPEAQRYLARLQQIAPGSPQVADLENTIRAGKVSGNELNEARRLAQSGQTGEAVEKYRQTFKGPPPSNFGVEYYTTLAGTPGGWEEARRGLEQLVQASPNDRQLRLALAQVLTYREPTRADGIAQLAQLSKDPVVGAAALQSWRQSLTWQGGSPGAKQQYEQYIAQYPQDNEIAQLLKEAATPVASAGNEAQSQAYEDLKRGNLGGAERQFAAELKDNPNDPPALGGLGLVRLRQQRFVEARDLLARAMRGAPEQAGDWTAAHDSAAFWATVQEAKGIARSNPARARQLLTGLLSRSRSDNWGVELVLGDIDLRLKDYTGAEQAYRRALRGRPGNVDAQVGLANALKGQGKTAEAQAIVSRLGPAAQARLAGPGAGGSQSEAIRTAAKEADLAGDKAGAAAKFQQAIALDPKNPWIRLDYARFLAAQGDAAQGFSIVNPANSGSTPTSMMAAAMYDTNQDRWPEALDKIDRIPPSARTQDIANFRERIQVRATIDRAKRLEASGRRTEARNLLVQLYRDSSIKGEEKRQVPYALFDMGDADAALQVTREVAARPGVEGRKASFDYAWMLIKTKHDDEAVAVLRQLEATGRLTADDQDDVNQLKITLATKRSDKVRIAGDYAGAYDQISALLAARPNDPVLLMAAGRIYAAAGRNREAMEYFEKAYQQDSGNIDVIRGVVGGALQAHEIGQAETWLNQGLESFPNNPRLFYLKAEIARANGDNRAAVQALETARALNSQQAASPSGGDIQAAPVPSATPPAPNPFRRSEAAPGVPFPFSLFVGSAAAATLDIAVPFSTAPAMIASADSDDLVTPPQRVERPVRGEPRSGATAARPQLAALGPTTPPETATAATSNLTRGWLALGSPVQLAQTELLPPPPIPIGPAPYVSPVGGTPNAEDSLELDIQRSLPLMEADTNPVLQGGFAFRARDGESGLTRLFEYGGAIEGRFSPALTGTLRFAILPLYLTADDIAQSALPRFGSNGVLAALGLPIPNPGSQEAGGVGLLASYSYGPASVQFGTSPLGFAVTNWLGGVAFAPKFYNDTITVRVEGLRQPVTDSVLSYAGTRTPLTYANSVSGGAFGNNPTWGGVTKSGGRLTVSYDDNDIGVYALGGMAVLDGTSVKDNGVIDAAGGVYFRPYRTETETVRAGVSLVYMGYDRNLSFFSYGQGGYFSPRNYTALTFPVEYSGRTGRWSYLAAVAAGVQTFNTRQSEAYPNNPSAQAQLAALVGRAAYYSGATTTSAAFNIKGQVEYALDNGVAVGAAAGFDNGRDFTEGTAKLYLRKTFGTTGAPVQVLPSSPSSLPVVPPGSL